MSATKGSYVADQANTGNSGLTAPRPSQVMDRRPTREMLAETVDGKESTYWYLHGFRTGRGDEAHRSPPLWQFCNMRAWRRGKTHGARYGAALILPSAIGARMFRDLFRLGEEVPGYR